MNDASAQRPVQLHVIHDLGGGSAKWLADFARADRSRTNLVLRSFAVEDAAGSGIALYAAPEDDAPIKAWRFSSPIPATVVAHREYRAALDEILVGHGVDAMIVSSLIGHSMEVLETGLPTLVVNHDYFPYCPSINLYFKSVCESCDGARVAQCERENDDFNPFVGFAPEDRERVRRRFVELARLPNVTMVAPSESVAANLTALQPAFARARFITIPHGYGEPLTPVAAPEPGDERLRILVLGQMSVAKGVDLLKATLAQIVEFADVYLVGAKELGELFRFEPHVHVTSNYDISELPTHVARINPHVGLLVSVVPETFSYALSELQMLGVPVAATSLGSFAERIRHGETGYLFDPTPAALVAQLQAIARDRETLRRIRDRISGWKPRTAEDMVTQYHALVPLEPRKLNPATAMLASRGAQADPQLSAALAGMWKEVKRLNLQLSIVNEARTRERFAEEARQVTLRNEFEALQRHVSALERADHDRATMLVRKEAELIDRDRELRSVRAQVQVRDAQVEELLCSTSWRLSKPVRWVGVAVRRTRKLANAGRVIVSDPARAPERIATVWRAWKDAGWPGVKKSLAGMQPSAQRDPWEQYCEDFRRHVRPHIVKAVGELARKPVISVLMAAYETPEALLREAIESVRRQLYPEWELCVVDDGSPSPHVARILKEYAARDARIKVRISPANAGVSSASNQALAMATGEFTILLDHDDLLEEQALFRFAETIIEDDPDLAYADEVLVAPPSPRILRYALRPAFSLEYLRSHPYIVHPVGFRTAILRRIGGFDEALQISQDYDLILRAVDASRRIVHIPEILYRWRQREGSSGRQQADNVMETSKAILRRHLQRGNLQATVGNGASFNLYEVRYPISASTRVGIVIPTKNHGELVRQCIETIAATVTQVEYEFIVVDHDSDDPATLAYLDSLTDLAQVIRHSGEFNFSVINNTAIARATGQFTHYLLCNNDIEAIEDGWLERMVELAQQPSVGVVGAQLLYPDRRSIQHGGVLVGAFGAAEHYAKRIRFGEDFIEAGYAEMLLLNHEVSAVTAACLLIRKDAFEAVRGFDEGIKVGFGDVDLCLRVLQAGYRVVLCPAAKLVHHESYTRGISLHDPHPDDSAMFRMKWRWLLDAGDPYYHPALSVTQSNWAVANPLPYRVRLRRRVVDLNHELGRQTFAFSRAA
jgi:GT2 family glycosyltransferase/glycosyltransferase involved in cell wall biosynthesis